jgi:uncharacterized protein
MNRPMALLALAVAAIALPASAATSYVQDGASLFSANTASQLNTRIDALKSQTGKEVVVVTVPSLNGEKVADAAQTVFNDQHINGILIFIAKDDRKDIIVPGTATARFFPAATNVDIRQAMESQFKSGDFDGGITGAVTSIVDIFNAHAQSAPSNTSGQVVYQRPSAVATTTRRSGGISMFWWIVIIVVGFLVLRSIMRAASGPRYYGGAPGPMGGPMGGPGYGGYGGGGGGSFWSGLLGGLGGAWLGNEMFGNRGGGYGGDGNIVQGGDQGGGWGGNSGGGDSGGWSSDSGADMGNSSGGDFSGGGFGGGDGGGGGDSGGGF